MNKLRNIEISFLFHSAAAAGLRPYSETGPRPHTSLYPVVSEGTWLEKNNYAQFDGWELRQLINFVAVSLIAIWLYELWFFVSEILIIKLRNTYSVAEEVVIYKLSLFTFLMEKIFVVWYCNELHWSLITASYQYLYYFKSKFLIFCNAFCRQMMVYLSQKSSLKFWRAAGTITITPSQPVSWK